MHQLREGMEINILEHGAKIDVAIVVRVGSGVDPATAEVEIESQHLRPGDRAVFAFFCGDPSLKEGWRMLFENPMSGGRCFSKGKSVYELVPVLC